MKPTIEICCGSFYDAKQAFLGGAQRVELCSALYLGGLTPSLGALRLTKEHTSLEIVAMSRPRAAGFYYQEEDFEALCQDTVLLLQNGADGVVFGCLTQAGEIHPEQTARVVELIHSHGGEAVFHRAFDCTNNLSVSAELLISLGIDRVLTSGGKKSALDGASILRELNARFGDRLQILAGGGVKAENAPALLKATGVTQLHSSCKAWLPDPTTQGQTVSYAYAPPPLEGSYEVVSAKRVAALVQAMRG